MLLVGVVEIGEVAGVRPVFGCGDETAGDRVVVQVFDLFCALGVGEDVEVVVTPLPESGISRPLELSRYLLLQYLQDNRE